MFSRKEMYIKPDSLQRRAEPAPRKGTLGNGPNLKKTTQSSYAEEGTEGGETMQKTDS